MSPDSFITFAYGSNMPSARLRGRCPSARAIGIAELRGHELRWHKRSKDGSGKCDIVAVDTPNTAAGCMSGNSDPECIPIMPRLYLDFTYVAGAGAAPEAYAKVVPQRLFSVLKP